MAVSYHNLLSKLDRALCAYLVSLGAGTAGDVLPAKKSYLKSLPCTICWTESGLLTAPYAGTFTLTTNVMVRTSPAIDPAQASGEAPRLPSDARVAATFDAFQSDIDSAGDKLAEDINQAAYAAAIEDPVNNGDLAQFTAFNVSVKGIEGAFEENTSTWVDTITLEICACPSVIPLT